jgi:hypothetical protein
MPRYRQARAQAAMLHGYGMDVLLRMWPRDLQAQYWTSEDTVKRQVFIDNFGSATGVILSAIASFNTLNPKIVILLRVTCLLNSLQLGWLLLARHRLQAYLRARQHITLVQRLLWPAATVIISNMGNVYYARAAMFPGTWRAFTNIAFTSRLMHLVNMINHPLPFLQELFLNIAFAVVDIYARIPVQLRSLRRYGVEDWVQPCCNYMRAILLSPALLHSEEGGNLCSELEPSFTLYAMLFVTTAVQLQATYWHEFSYKAKYLHRLQVEAARAGTAPGEVSDLEEADVGPRLQTCIACTWAGAAVAWCAAGLWVQWRSSWWGPAI